MMAKFNAAEILLSEQLKRKGWPPFERELRFDAVRRWRFDLASPTIKLAIEIEGGLFLAKSRHITGKGYVADLEKYNAAAMDGWTVLRFSVQQVENGYALEKIREFLEAKR